VCEKGLGFSAYIRGAESPVLQCVAVCCSVLQCVAERPRLYSIRQRHTLSDYSHVCVGGGGGERERESEREKERECVCARERKRKGEREKEGESVCVCV